MKRLIAAATTAGLIAIAALSGTSVALAADKPAPGPAAAASQGGADQGWFPGFLEACKQQGLTDADCQKRFDERKQIVIGICAKQNITGEEACRKWVNQKREEQMEQARVICKDNGVSGGDEECKKWIEQKRAQFISDFKAQCQKDGLNDDQCRERFVQYGQKVRANQEFLADCTAKGGTKEDCMAKLRASQGGAQGGAGGGEAGGSSHMAAPAQPDKGSALPPPTK